MIWRIRDRATFGAFRTRGIRARSGPLVITYLPPTDQSCPPRVAFAIGRHVGHAVERNRLRRRLRAIFVEIDQQCLPTGAYLVSGQAEAAVLPYQELRTHVKRALTHIEQKTGLAVTEAT